MINTTIDIETLSGPSPNRVGGGPLTLSARSWAVFEGGRDAYVIMVMSLAFMPYFVTQVVGNPVRGQALAASYAKYSGVMVALTAPFLGAIVDKLGPRKPWLAGSGLIAAFLAAFLWIAKPGSSEGIVTTVLWLTAIVSVLAAYTDVFHNSMMPYAATRAEQARASGLALALGNLVSLIMIVFLLWGFSLPGVLHSRLVPAKPLFGFNSLTGDNTRIVGPLSAAAMFLSLIPLMLFSRDAKPTGASLMQAVQLGASELWTMLRHLRVPRDASFFLLSRMLFADARVASLMFFGIYAAGVMKWGARELLLVGLLGTVVGVFGGFLAGWVDTRIGAKRALILEITVLIVCLVAQLTITPEQIFFIPYPAAQHPPLWSIPVFNTLPQAIFLLIFIPNGLAGTAVFSSSRTMLTAVAPKDNVGAFFGLYALSGAATAWLAPFLVEFTTKIFHSQQAGMLPIAGLFLVAIVLMASVRQRGLPDATAPRA